MNIEFKRKIGLKKGQEPIEIHSWGLDYAIELFMNDSTGYLSELKVKIKQIFNISEENTDRSSSEETIEDTENFSITEEYQDRKRNKAKIEDIKDVQGKLIGFVLQAPGSCDSSLPLDRILIKVIGNYDSWTEWQPIHFVDDYQVI